MAVSHDDVRHIAALARLGLEPDRIGQLALELSGILAHMDVLAAVDTSRVESLPSLARPGATRTDDGPPIPLTRTREEFAPETREGFFLVPRLSTHEDGAEAS